SGVTGAAPLWNRIFLKLHENNLPATFQNPENMIEKPICALSGLKPTPACPMVVTEYFWTQDLAYYESHPDTFYQPVNSSPINLKNREILTKNSSSRLNLPPEYDQWLAQQTDLQTQINGVNILFPHNGSKLLLSPSPKPTRLAFKITNSDRRSLEWWLNGQKMNVSPDSTWFWPMEVGQWQLEIKQIDQKGSLKTLDSVEFEIQKVEPKSVRGFSMAPNP
ncbi:MAG: penicillin-binding protein 1C, partial [Microcystaceae cyanobacterium]